MSSTWVGDLSISGLGDLERSLERHKLAPDLCIEAACSLVARRNFQLYTVSLFGLAESFKLLFD